MTETAIMIFAAGFGTRMGNLTADRPKPLIKVAGKTLLDHALDLTHHKQIARRVVNTHFKGEMIRAHLSGTDILISDEGAGLLETGGGLRKALPLLNANPVMTLNSDAVWAGPDPVRVLIDAWAPQMEALLMVVPTQDAVGHQGKGDFDLSPAGHLARGTATTYTGLQMIRTDRLLAIDDVAFSMNVIWDQMLAAGTIHGVIYPGQWCDVGQPHSIALAEHMLLVNRDV